MRGLYVLNTNTNKNPQNFATPGLSGVVISLGWQDIETANGKFDWSNFDAAFAQVPAGLNVSLAISAGLQAPSWVAEIEGMPTVELSINTRPHGPASNVKLACAWTPLYVAAFTTLMEEVKTHLSTLGFLGRVVALRHGLFAGLDSEMEILWTNTDGPVPANATAYAAVGYRTSTVLAVHKAFATTLLAMFPGKVIIQSLMTPKIVFPWIDETGNVLTKDNSTENVAAMITDCGETFGMSMAFMDTAMSTVSIDATLAAVQDSGCRFVGQSNAWGGPQGAMTGDHLDPTPGTTEGFVEIVQNTVSYGAIYFEAHSADAEKFGTVFPECAALLN